jgi:hypothetical protein
MESSRVGRGGLFGIASDGGSQQVTVPTYVSDCGDRQNINGVAVKSFFGIEKKRQ